MNPCPSEFEPAKLRVAIVHDWLTVYGGAERVLEQILAVFPGADLYAVCDFVPPAQRGFLGTRTPATTFVQRLPWARRFYRHYLPLMALAIEQLDVSGYDLVLSSSHAVAKGVLTGPDQLHVSYVHSPMRYAWDMQHQYLRESKLDRGLKSWMARWLLHRMRIWDLRTANGVDLYLANSRFIARRIEKTYRREAQVIYPPVNLEAFTLREHKEDFYLCASRLVPYKRMDLLVEAFRAMPGRRLKVVGDGPDRARLSRMAAGCPNIEMLGHCSGEELSSLMGRARAFVFAAEEDFGIVPLEAQACGTPVIAFGRGGALETVDGLDEQGSRGTGLFFEQQTVDAVVRAVERFEARSADFSPQRCRAKAMRFDAARFRTELFEATAQAWEAFNRRTQRDAAATAGASPRAFL